jgi:two-component system, chemotaxis family, chemotaxis protein CheY
MPVAHLCCSNTIILISFKKAKAVKVNACFMSKTILVIDNFTSIRDFVCESLTKKGYQAVGVSNVNEAYRMIIEKTEPIDLVISDYNMRECTGFEFLNRIKSSDKVEQPQFMFLTSELNLEKIKKENETGFFTWLKKPYQMDILFSQIEKIIDN